MSQPATILVVDDNPTNLKLIRVLLLGEGYQVRSASSAEEAQALLEQGLWPDLVLMDIQLPGMDGLSLTRALRANVRTRALRILALTAYAMAHDQQRALDAGCDGYLAKPIDTRTFADVIRVHLGQEQR